MSRKLATVRTVREVLPIDGADRIEIVKVDGWQSITQKNQFKVGDQGVYFEYDSWLPDEPKYAFLKERCYCKNEFGDGMRLKTMKLKKQLTQGLLMPLNDYPEIPCNIDGKYNEELDYTELLNVKLYQIPISTSIGGQVKGQFPSYISKTDEERIQNLPEYFSTYKDVVFEASEKLDGTSSTYYLCDGIFGVCSRNLDLFESEKNIHWKMAKKYGIEDILRKYRELYSNENLAIQGEIIGEGIQKNKYNLSCNHFHIFKIFSIDKYRYLDYIETKNVFEKLLLCQIQGTEKLNYVPILEMTKIFQRFSNIDAILEYVRGNSILNPKSKKEGVVFKSEYINGNIISFKVINNDYLLEERE